MHALTPDAVRVDAARHATDAALDERATRTRLGKHRSPAPTLPHFLRPFLPIVLVAAVVVSLLATTSVPARAQGVGDLLVAPTRMIFDGRKRTAEIVLLNIGTETATYRVSFVRQRMTEDGKFEKVEKPLPGELFSDDLIRFTPRQVVLEPRVAQVIRLQVRKPAELAAGEYRSHLLFRAIPPAPTATAPAPGDPPPTGLGIKLIPVYGVSIAIIVRHNTSPATVTLSDLQYTPAPSETEPGVLALRMDRTGDQSVYGDFSVTFTPDGGKGTQVAKAGGVAVYTPNDHRLFTMPIKAPEGMSIGSGKLSVVFREKPEDGGAVLAEGSIAVP